MATRLARLRVTIRDGLFAAAGLAALALAVWVAARPWVSRPHALALAAGRMEGARYGVALALQSEATRHGLDVSMVDQAGSLAALDWVDAAPERAALIQGGLRPGRRTHVRQVAALYVEPLHLLVRPELLPAVTRSLAALRGKFVNLGEPGSGTRALAEDVMTFAGLDRHRGDYTAGDWSYRRLREEPDRAGLPDAAFMVSTLPSAVAGDLIARRGYRLAPVPFGKVFWIEAAAGIAPPGRDRVDPLHVYDAEIPALAYERDPPVPERTLPTLGTRLLLVAHEDDDPQAVRRLLAAVFDSGFARRAQPPIDARVLDLPPEFPLHAGTERNRQRNQPLIAEDMVDALDRRVNIAAASLGGIFFLWQWYRRRSRRRSDLSFESYILRVADVERRALALEMGETLDLARLLVLREELSRLKSEALRQFADGALAGEELMSGFLAHVGDARDHLTRLILHERDNLEDLARQQGRSPEAVWREVVGRPLPGAATIPPENP